MHDKGSLFLLNMKQGQNIIWHYHSHQQVQTVVCGSTIDLNVLIHCSYKRKIVTNQLKNTGRTVNAQVKEQKDTLLIPVLSYL